MNIVKNFQMMALYNQRINQQLMKHCIAMPENLLKKDTKSFFSSIIHYWNHLIFGDLILMNRLIANEQGTFSAKNLSCFPTPKTPQDVYSLDISELATLRYQIDDVIIHYCQQLSETTCAQQLSYKTTEGDLVIKRAADVIQHLFNHQTHHRGQLTCVLSQFGVDYGCMDLPIIVPQGSDL